MLKHYPANHTWQGTQRFYKTPQGPLPGVTTLLGATKTEPGLVRWRKRIGDTEADRIMKDACERGTLAHAAIEGYLRDKTEPDVGSPSRCYFDSVQSVLGLIEEVLLIEGYVWSPKGYAGTIDCITTIEGTPYIVDWKTSSKPKRPEWINNYFLQLAAYCGAANHVYPDLKVNRGIVAIALPDQPAQVFIVEPKEMMGYWREWLGRVEVFQSAVAA
jgi:hypothetical protein